MLLTMIIITHNSNAHFLTIVIVTGLALQSSVSRAGSGSGSELIKKITTTGMRT